MQHGRCKVVACPPFQEALVEHEEQEALPADAQVESASSASMGATSEAEDEEVEGRAGMLDGIDIDSIKTEEQEL